MPHEYHEIRIHTDTNNGVLRSILLDEGAKMEAASQISLEQYMGAFGSEEAGLRKHTVYHFGNGKLVFLTKQGAWTYYAITFIEKEGLVSESNLYESGTGSMCVEPGVFRVETSRSTPNTILCMVSAPFIDVMGTALLAFVTFSVFKRMEQRRQISQPAV